MVMKLITKMQRIVNAASYKSRNYFNSFPKNEGVELFKRDT